MTKSKKKADRLLTQAVLEVEIMDESARISKLAHGMRPNIAIFGIGDTWATGLEGQI
jgi:hypothetical protein